MGYNGFTKIIGYWDETPEDENSKPIAEESYVVLNVGNQSFEDFVTDMVMLCKDVDDEGNDQQAVMVWSHEDKLAYVFNNKGDITNTFNDFKIDNISQVWSQIGNHKLTFVEESVNESFSDTFNENGNWITAMGIENNRHKYRKDIK